MEYKSGFVSVVGRPNVGKSTLVNKIIGEKISIISAKPQTTRHRLKMIYTSDRGQIIFVDTPGVHKPQNELDKYMLDELYDGLKDVDLILFLVDAGFGYGKGDQFIFEKIKKSGVSFIPVMNKIDILDEKVLAKRKKDYERNINEKVITISAQQNLSIDKLITKIFSELPSGPQYYPEDMITDQIERFIVQEFIREKIFLLTRDEIPYGCAVIIEDMTERENNDYFIRASIYVEKKSHKGIIIGKNGKMIKEIGRQARKDIEKLLQEKVYLDLWVKIEKKWRQKEYLVKRMGYK